MKLTAEPDPLGRAWLAVIVFVPAFASLSSEMVSIDLAYHVRVGHEILASWSIPRFDRYTFTAQAQPWMNQQWGSQVLLHLLYVLGGWEAIAVIRAALVGVSFWLVWQACRWRGATPRTASILTLAGFLVALPTLSMRPQLFSVPVFATCVWALASRHAHPRRLWLLPIAASLVANLHGSFVLIPLLGALVAVADVREGWMSLRRAGVLVGVTTVATLVNPFGPEVWRYAYDLATDPIIREIVKEWAPISFANISGWLLLTSVLLLLAYVPWRRVPGAWPDLLTLGVFLALAASSVRAFVWWGMLAPAIVAGLRPIVRNFEPSHASVGRAVRASRLPSMAIAATLAAVTVVALPWSAPGSRLLEEAPEGIAEATSRLPSGTRVLAPQPWGSWLEFASPNLLLFVDSRIELFPRAVWEGYGELAYAGSGWREVLSTWAPDAIVADKARWQETISLLRRHPGYVAVYEDEDGVLFMPASSPVAPYSGAPTATSPDRVAMLIAARRVPTPSLP